MKKECQFYSVTFGYVTLVSHFIYCFINTRQNDRIIFSVPWALRALTVTKYCVIDVLAVQKVLV